MKNEEVRHSDHLDFILRLNDRKKTKILVLIFVSILLLYGLDKTGSVVKSTPTEITIFADEWEFVPNVVKVNYRDPVKINLVTSTNRSFGFKLSRYMYNDLIIIEPNETKTLEFNAHTKGVFTFRCEGPCGWGKNLMVGRLIVE